jgi:hypothetical protein
MHSVTSENDYEIITNIQQKLIFEKISPSKSTGDVLHELLHELNQLKADLTGLIYLSHILKSSRIFLDEPKSSSSYESRPFGAEKVRFDTDQDNTTTNERFNTNRTANAYRFRRQQQIDDTNLNVSPKKRTEKIQVKNALDILEPYYARYKIRCAGKFRTH